MVKAKGDRGFFRRPKSWPLRGDLAIPHAKEEEGIGNGEEVARIEYSLWRARKLEGREK
jgi:hypothetical protein